MTVASAAVLIILIMAAAPVAGEAQQSTPAAAAAPAPAAPGVKATPPATAAAGSCKECHAPLLGRGIDHQPAADDCTTCHLQNGTAHSFALFADGAELCANCHEVVKETDQFVHGPVATGDCVSCHEPHSTAAPKLVRTEGSALCESCHVDMTASIAQHRLTHAPVKTGCAQCHDPHSAPNKYQLKSAGSALCFGCHKPIADLVGLSRVKHDAVTMDRECLNCHDPHVADVPPQLRAATMTLCLDCHDREVPMGDGVPLTNMKALLIANPDHHGPIRQEDCSACHMPHGGFEFRLLKKAYPQKFYSAFDPTNYELCFMCHQPDLVEVERTTTLTGFRDGDRNLHFVHVNQPEKGRTCRACHEVHASTKPKHIRETVPFGSWNLPIKYESAIDGGKCAPGCHVPREYRRGDQKLAADGTQTR